MKKLIFACALGLSLSACSISHNEETSHPLSPAANVSDTSTSSTVTDSYQFEVNGCDTGYHAFTSNSKEETLRQYCEALQTDSVNNGCAEGLRRNMFEMVCPGVWSPR